MRMPKQRFAFHDLPSLAIMAQTALGFLIFHNPLCCVLICVCIFLGLICTCVFHLAGLHPHINLVRLAITNMYDYGQAMSITTDWEFWDLARFRRYYRSCAFTEQQISQFWNNSVRIESNGVIYAAVEVQVVTVSTYIRGFP